MMWSLQVLDHRVVVLMDPAKVNQEVDPLRVNRTREKRFVVGALLPLCQAHFYGSAKARSPKRRASFLTSVVPSRLLTS